MRIANSNDFMALVLVLDFCAISLEASKGDTKKKVYPIKQITGEKKVK